ncbi:MAG TPA: xanthine permease [Syntrophus sp. (in: bacteria)]|nr:MAG: xanthine permease [Syntrophus sp. GWC2_56_31]HBB18019.1 xanthine permease [Syntrophus sp. (in: bacteria)]
MKYEYELDQRPTLLKSFLFGMQWAAIAISLIIILGKVAGSMHFREPEDLIVYLQKMFFLTGATLFCQVLWGHRLPIICGPATVLLIGIIASQSFEINVIYSSIMVGGLIIALFAVSGIFSYLQRLFTKRVVATVLMLIAFTLAPTILKLVTDLKSGVEPLSNLSFAISLVFVMFLLNRFLAGVWKSTLIIWAMILGSVTYLLLFPGAETRSIFAQTDLFSGFFSRLTFRLSFEPGVLISFIFCFLALSINDLGSIQSMITLLDLKETGKRITRGITVTGLANIAAGFFGVLGTVNFSLSPGVIASTGCASRFALIPASAIIGLLAFFPAAIGIIAYVPSVVIGCVLIYILSSQIAAGLVVAFQGEGKDRFDINGGLAIGLPVLLGTVVAFLPGTVIDTFPLALKPILGNGFVVGVAAALALEHVIFKR